MKHIKKCVKCNEYTLKEKCPKCDGDTIIQKPPKYSIEDKYAEYRRVAKKQLFSKKEEKQKN